MTSRDEPARPTLQRWLRSARARLAQAGIPGSEQEPAWLVADWLGCAPTDLVRFWNRELIPEEQAFLDGRVSRRLAREPLQYILGYESFMGYRFEVNGDVLIPRPETEELAEMALDWLDSRGYSNPFLCDVGAGCGALSVALARRRPDARVWATDLSAAALDTARRNAERLGVADRVAFANGDLFEPLDSSLLFDLIVSNPPYIRSDAIQTLQPEVGRHEPRMALDGGEDGMDLIRKIIAEAPNRLRSGGRVMLEVGYDQGLTAEECLKADGRYASVALGKDLSGVGRLLWGETA